jgi:hypothetical protein
VHANLRETNALTKLCSALLFDVAGWNSLA